MLSSQTKVRSTFGSSSSLSLTLLQDPVTHQATMNLRNGLRGGLSLEGLLDATVDEIDALICKVGFHQTKAMNLQYVPLAARSVH